MVSVKNLFSAEGLETPHHRIKLVKHIDHDRKPIHQILVDNEFEIYQRIQGKKRKPFHNADVILSFIATGANKARFVGAYHVRGERDVCPSDLDDLPSWERDSIHNFSDLILYDLQKDDRFTAYKDRLVIQWKSTRGWFQEKDLDVYEILPPESSQEFPGYQNVLLDHQQLINIFKNPSGHRDWMIALKSVAGIYRIIDPESGKTYIGSAYGSDGIWQRWKEYAASGHGGNKLLKGLDPSRFQWSIVRTLSRVLSAHEVIKLESLEKRKHGSKAFGLNDN